MLTSLHIKNFKAWKDTGEIRLAPLTVIFGANSAGKSSLGHLLLALKLCAQTMYASFMPKNFLAKSNQRCRIDALMIFSVFPIPRIWLGWGRGRRVMTRCCLTRKPQTCCASRCWWKKSWMGRIWGFLWGRMALCWRKTGGNI